MALLTWRDACRGDRGKLSLFKCATDPQKQKVPPYGLVHERLYAYKVQCLVRGELTPPYRPPLFLRVGTDGDDAIRAVSWFEEEDAGDFFLKLMAIDLALQQTGGAYANEMVVDTLDAITTRGIERGLGVVSVSAIVHEDNHASQNLCQRWEFGLTGLREDDLSLQIWSRELLLDENPALM